MSVHTGGFGARHARGKDPVIEVPPKITGDVKDHKLSGLAKASPFFNRVKEIIQPKTQEEEKKTIAEFKETIEPSLTEEKEVNDGE